MKLLIPLAIILSLLLAGDSFVAQQPLPTEPPTTVVAISWTIVLAEAVVIGVLWRQIGLERKRIDGVVEILRQNMEATKDIRRALQSLDKRLSVHDDVRELLRRTED